MKNYFSSLGIFIGVLVIGLIFSAVKGIIWPDKDILEVKSSIPDGNTFVSENRVKFIPDRVIGTFWTDFYISKKGIFVYNFSQNLAKETISYIPLDEKFVKHYELLPTRSWWQSYGIFVLLGIGLVISIFGKSLLRLVLAILGEV